MASTGNAGAEQGGGRGRFGAAWPFYLDCPAVNTENTWRYEARGCLVGSLGEGGGRIWGTGLWFRARTGSCCITGVV